jgi:hypothetical protein
MKNTAGMRRAVSCTVAVLIAATALAVTGNSNPGSVASGSTQRLAEPQIVEQTPDAPPEPGKKKRDTYPFRGVIASMDATERTLTLEGKKVRRLIRLTEMTRIEKHGGPATFADLQPGDALGGTLRKNTDGVEEALLLRVGPKSDSVNRPRVAGGSGPTKLEVDQP